VILTFLAMPGEVDLATVNGPFERAVTRTPRKGPLTIHRLTDELEPHPFGYLQPRADAPTVEPQSIEAVLVPGVLFGLDGSRLGHGRGYYDKLLASFTHRPFLLGVTLQRRLVSEVPMTRSDVYMDAVVTELGVRPANSATR
jgi:5-formyltetrahydrofolate cyclo-ligase